MVDVNVYTKDGKSVSSKVAMPKLFDIELRSDLVRKTYDNVRQNMRQPYAVAPEAGKQHSAESWGTGRAMARVPRVKASGTRRAGQAAFANFARKGRMAHPTQTHRRWHKQTPLNVRRMVSCMGVAASANAAIVEGRGHRVAGIKSLPIVISSSVSEIQRTKEAHELLVNLSLGAELERVRDSKTITCGKGKFRGRRYNKRTGILVVHDTENVAAFKNIEGVETASVDQLNLLRLCPGGQLGRLIVWTESAFKKLETVFSEECKKGFVLPNKMISSGDLDEYFYSPEVQSLITTPDLLPKGTTQKSTEELEKQNAFLALW